MSEIENIDITFKQINRNILKGWVVFYYINNELIKYSSDTHNWADLPKIGVQALFRIYIDDTKEIVTGVDYYCPYQLMNIDDIRPWIKFGLYLENNLYNNTIWPYIINHEINR